MRDLSKVLIDISLTSMTVGGLLIPFFFAINQLSGDFERKTIYSILSREVSRNSYIVGRFFGLSLLVFSIMSILFLSTCFSIEIAGIIYPDNFFQTLSYKSLLFASFLSFLSICLLNASSIFWSSITTSSFLATLLTLCTYMIGQSIEDLVRFAISYGETINISTGTLNFLKIIMYIFPNLASFDYKQAAAYGLTIPLLDLFSLFIYCMTYCIILLRLSIFFFNKRDL